MAVRLAVLMAKLKAVPWARQKVDYLVGVLVSSQVARSVDERVDSSVWILVASTVDLMEPAMVEQ